MSDAGRVVGIDVGYSRRARTTGICLLGWDAHRVRMACARAGSDEGSRLDALQRLGLAPGDAVDALAIDGPLRPGLKFEASYRSAESALSRGIFQRRGKPGQTNAGSGPQLHRAATDLAELSIRHMSVGTASSPIGLLGRNLVEAFPNLFLGVLCGDSSYPDRPVRRRRWTDTLFPLVEQTLEKLLSLLLPERAVSIDRPRHHEDIASFTCALTALSFASGEFVAVGSRLDGYILLPPLWSWGLGAGGARWAEVALQRSVDAARQKFPSVECLISHR